MEDLLIVGLIAAVLFSLSWYLDPKQVARRQHRDFQRGWNYVKGQLTVAHLDDKPQVRQELWDELNRAWDRGQFERGMHYALMEKEEDL